MANTTRMIDIGGKNDTKRLAKATAFVKLDKKIISMIKKGDLPKGDVLGAARIAGINGAKKTSDLIPLCHNIGLDYAGVDFKINPGGVEITSEARSTGKTGVEMEALTICAIASLTIYDMCKMFSQRIEIGKMYLLEKRGGKSGTYERKE